MNNDASKGAKMVKLPADHEVQWAYHGGGGQSGQPHETTYKLYTGEIVTFAGHHLGR